MVNADDLERYIDPDPPRVFAYSCAEGAPIHRAYEESEGCYRLSGDPAFELIGEGITFTVGAAAQTFTIPELSCVGHLRPAGVARPFGTYAALVRPMFYVPEDAPLSIYPLGQEWHLAILGPPEDGTVWPVRLDGLRFCLRYDRWSVVIGGSIDAAFDTAGQTLAVTWSHLVAVRTREPVERFFDLSAGEPVSVRGHWTNLVPEGSTPWGMDIADHPDEVSCTSEFGRRILRSTAEAIQSVFARLANAPLSAGETDPYGPDGETDRRDNGWDAPGEGPDPGTQSPRRPNPDMPVE